MRLPAEASDERSFGRLDLRDDPNVRAVPSGWAMVSTSCNSVSQSSVANVDQTAAALTALEEPDVRVLWQNTVEDVIGHAFRHEPMCADELGSHGRRVQSSVTQNEGISPPITTTVSIVCSAIYEKGVADQ
jgi:hypothetical protein